MKKILYMLLLLLPYDVMAIDSGDVYVGFGCCSSRLKYDLSENIKDSIAEDPQLQNGVNFFNISGGSFDVNSKQFSGYNKFFIGYRLSEYFSIEYFNIRTDAYSVDISGTTSLSYTNTDGALAADINISGRANVNLFGHGIKINGYIPVAKKVDLVIGFGVSYMKINYDYTYSIDGDASVNSNKYALQYGDDGDKTITGVLPVMSLGILYALTKNVSIGVEAEMFGIPIDDNYISTKSINLIYSF